MAEITAIERHLRLWRILAARKFGATLQELADETGVGVRTIRCICPRCEVVSWF